VIEPTDGFAMLARNENPYGPSQIVRRALERALGFAHRYAPSDGGLVEAIAHHHRVGPGNVLLGAGSREILATAAAAFLRGDRQLLTSQPSYTAIDEHAAGLGAGAIKVRLAVDYRQDIRTLIRVARARAREIGLVYVCNPNNPTGIVVTAAEVRQLLDGIPRGIPMLIDEAYHHYVDDPEYETAVGHVRAGGPLLVTRTFSKIAGLAGLRLGYAIGSEHLIAAMRPHRTGGINALAAAAGAAALTDTEEHDRVRAITLEIRRQVTSELELLGYTALPSRANFVMVHVRRPITTVIAAFQERGVLVGRPFPPMDEHLRVSIGTKEEMRRFMRAFRDIFDVDRSRPSGEPVAEVVCGPP
jgi:histidinol-phosphate aminotransferase